MSQNPEARQRSTRHLVGWILVAVAIAQGVALTVYLLAQRPDTTPALPAPEFTSTTESDTAEQSSSSTVPIVSMPDLADLSRERAIEVLLDSGVRADSVVVEERAWVSPSGVVVDQLPAAGETIEGEVSLHVSAPAEVPDLLGLEQGEAEAALTQFGALPDFKVAYLAGSVEGTVISQNPDAGSSLPPVVGITLAAASGDLFLTELDYVDRDSCDFRELRTDGIEFATTIRCTGRLSAPTSWIDYDLGRDFETFTVTVGISDEAEDTTATFGFRILTDEAVAAETMVGFGESVDLEVDVTNALRLRLEASVIGAVEERQLNEAVWGDPTLSGDPAVVSEIQGS